MKNIPIGQGHGVAGRFGGLPDPYGSESFAQAVILPVPFDKTSTYQRGSDQGPQALIEASRNLELYDIELDSEVYLKGIYTAPPILAETSEEMLEQSYQQAFDFFKKGKFVVTLGGEHSISYAPIRAAADHFGGISVIQFDAHLDLQPSYENNPWSHASVMARVKELPHLKKLLAVGIRSMSKEELPYVDPTYTFFAHQRAYNELPLEKLEDPVYITFDLDVFDSSLMPSTGTPEPGGLQWYEALDLLRRIFTQKRVVGLDIVELLPRACNPAPDYLAAKLLYKALTYRYFKLPQRTPRL